MSAQVPEIIKPLDVTKIHTKDIFDLLTYFSSHIYSAPCQDIQVKEAMRIARDLFEKDYKLIEIDNSDGSLSFQYPTNLLIPVAELNSTVEEQPIEIDPIELRSLIESAKFGRCRQRFPLPVILYQNKYICRSATISSDPEICYRAGVTDVGFEALYALKQFLWPTEESPPESHSLDDEEITHTPFCDKVREQDIKLLQAFNVDVIVDIMVEKRKVKHGLYVSSSEKVDKGRYSEFQLCSMPYPGCEFFVSFDKNYFNSENLYYNWNNPACDAELSVPPQPNTDIIWQYYKTWDLNTLTQNYIRYILTKFQKDSRGILLHCISGWDRTPLYISLLRLSLWADGLIHKSLNVYQMLYLTIAYDWMLCGHHLYTRISRDEEIFNFCFHFLKYISTPQFGLVPTTFPPEGDPACISPRKTPSPQPNISQTSSSSASSSEGSGTSIDNEFNTCVNGSRQRQDSDSFSESFEKITITGSTEDLAPIEPTVRHQRLAKLRQVFLHTYFNAVKIKKYAFPDQKVMEDIVILLGEKLQKGVRHVDYSA